MKIAIEAPISYTNMAAVFLRNLEGNDVTSLVLRHLKGWKEGLVHTVCTCAAPQVSGEFGNLRKSTLLC